METLVSREKIVEEVGELVLRSKPETPEVVKTALTALMIWLGEDCEVEGIIDDDNIVDCGDFHKYRIPIREENTFLPEYGNDGSMLKGSHYAVIDPYEKVDTGMYGCIYYEQREGVPNKGEE